MSFAGWYVWHSRNTNTSNSSNANSQTQKSSTTPTTSSKPTITDVDLTLQRVGDEQQLKNIASDSFVAYMKDKLASFDCDYTQFPEGGISVSRISEHFVAGGTGCGGGAAMFWFFKDNSWQELGTQDVVPCTTVIADRIPEEFIDQCNEDVSGYKLVPNPNGSLSNY